MGAGEHFFLMKGAHEAVSSKESPMRYRILIVDDEELIRKFFKWFLAHKGIEVVTAANGAEALERLRTERPDLMLLDMAMPVMGGVEALKRTRRLDENLPIIMMAGVDDIEAAESLKGLGAQGFLAKPFDLPDLEDILERQLPPVPRGGAGGV